MKPLVNWDALQEMFTPRPPEQAGARQGDRPAMPGGGIGGWDKQAPFYNMMTELETPYTLKQLECFEVEATDTVLDVCCGPGRLVVPLAKKAARVTALDSSPVMLDFCKQHADEAGVSNIDYLIADWNEVGLGKGLEQHDIVLSSRSAGLWDVEKLSGLARKWVGIIIWHYGCPSIPDITNKIFDGVDDAPPMISHNAASDRRLGDNVWYNRIYDMGYDVNLRVLEDGYTRSYASREDAYADLRRLYNRGEIPASGEERFRSNVDSYTAENADGTYTFLIKTGSIVLWWKPEKQF